MRSKLPPDNTYPLCDKQVAQFDEDGYLMIENLFDQEEIALMMRVAQDDRLLHQHAYGRKDAQGRESRLSLWNHPGDDLFGVVSRSRRRGISLPLEADAQGTVRGRGLGMAPGLWLLVSERVPVPLDGQLPDRPGPRDRANGCLQVLKG